MLHTTRGAIRTRWLAGLALGGLALLAAADGPPVEIWTHVEGSDAGNAYGQDVAIDSHGNVITAGYLDETLVGAAGKGSNGFLQKWRYADSEAWTVTVDNPDTDTVASASLDGFYGVCVDGDDNVIAVGTWSGDWGTPAIGYWMTLLVQRYTPDGVLDWEWKGGKDYGPWSVMEAVAVDPDGNVLAVGRSVATPTSGADWAIVKLSPDGAMLPGFPILFSLSSGVNVDDAPYAVAAHSDGSFVVAGMVENTADDSDWHVRRYSADGTPAWNDTWSGATNRHDAALGVSLDAQGNAYVAGYTTADPGADHDGLLIKYSPAGVRLWTVVNGGDPGERIVYTDVVHESGDTLTVVGYGRPAGSTEYVGINEGRSPEDGSLYGGDTQEFPGGQVFITAADTRGRLLGGTGYFGVAGSYEIFTSLGELPNSAPVIDEPPTAGTQLGAIGEVVPFSVSAHDPDGDALSVTWDFGDGTFGSGLTTTHAYTTAGPFLVDVTVSDNQDSVGDGTSFEVGIPVESPSVKAKLNFKKEGKDAVTFKCRLDLTEHLLIDGETVTIDVGGARETFTLNKKGKARTDAGKVSLKYKKKKGLWQLTARLEKGDFADDWADEGLLDATQRKTPVVIKATVELGAGIRCAHMVDALYTAKTGKWGKTK